METNILINICIFAIGVLIGMSIRERRDDTKPSVFEEIQTQAKRYRSLLNSSDKPTAPLNSTRREDGGYGTCPKCGSTLSREAWSWTMLKCDNHPECDYIITKEAYARMDRRTATGPSQEPGEPIKIETS